MATEVGTAYVSILPSLKGFSSKLKAELRGELRGIDPVVGEAGHRAGRNFGDRMAESLRGGIARIGAMLKTGLVVAAAAAVAGLGALTTFGLKSAAAMEQTQIGIESLLGSADEAKKFLAELQQFSAKTPFEFAGVADASKRILAFGQAVGITRDEVIPTLTTIGDLVSVLGGGQESIDSVLRAFGQISSKGRVQQEELLQLAEALPGFNANAAIAKALGVTVPEAMEKISAGGVDATTAINALLQGMQDFPGAANAMERQSQTLLGVFSTFKDTIGIALTNAFQPVIPAIKDALTELTPIVGQAIDALAPSLGGLLSALLPLLGTFTQVFAPILGPLLDAISQTIPIITPGLQAVGAAFGQITATLAPLVPVLSQVGNELLLALADVLVALVPSIAELVPALADMLISLIPLIPPLTELIALSIRAQGPLYELAAAAIAFLTAEGLVPLVNLLAKAMGALVKWATPIVNFSDSLDKMKEHLGELADKGKAKLDELAGFFQTLPGRIMGFVQELPGRLAAWAKQALEDAAFAVGYGIGRVIRFFIDLPGNVIGAVKELPGKLSAFFTSAVDNGKTAVSTGVDNIVSFFRDLPGKAVDAVKDLPAKLLAKFAEFRSTLVQLGRDIIGGIVQGIKDTASGIASSLWDGVKSAVDGVKRGLLISSPSKVMAEVGEDTVAGYVMGVEQSARDAALATTAAIAPAAASTGGATAAAPQRLQLELVGGDDNILAAFKEAIRVRNGGDVQGLIGSSAVAA